MKADIICSLFGAIGVVIFYAVSITIVNRKKPNCKKFINSFCLFGIALTVVCLTIFQILGIDQDKHVYTALLGLALIGVANAVIDVYTSFTEKNELKDLETRVQKIEEELKKNKMNNMLVD